MKAGRYIPGIKQFCAYLKGGVALPAFCALLVLCSACERERTTRFIEEEREDAPTHRSDNITVQFMDSNRVKAVLRAGEARVYEDRMKTFLQDSIRVDFLSASRSKSGSVLYADSAEIDDRTKDMRAMGRVVVISDSSNTSLQTSLLMWDAKRQKLYSTEYVHIESATEILRGYGFESDQYLKNYVIFNVSGVKYKAGAN